MASPVIADPFHRMKYMERHGSGLRKIVRETEKPPGYTAAYNPKIFSTAKLQWKEPQRRSAKQENEQKKKEKELPKKLA